MTYKLIEKEITAHQFTKNNLFELEVIFNCKIDKTSISLTEESKYTLRSRKGAFDLPLNAFVFADPTTGEITVMEEVMFNNTYVQKL